MFHNVNAQQGMEKKHKKIIRSIILLIVILSIIILFISECGVALVPVTTRYAYQPILKFRWKTEYLIEHFPSKISEKAKDVKFYYRAGLWQGGSTIELRMKLPVSDFDSVVQNYRSRAIIILDHLGKPVNIRQEEKDITEIMLHFFTVSREELTDEYRIGPLPADYEIFLLRLEGSWNHGKTAVIAVNQLKKEVIFRAEAW